MYSIDNAFQSNSMENHLRTKYTRALPTVNLSPKKLPEISRVITGDADSNSTSAECPGNIGQPHKQSHRSLIFQEVLSERLLASTGRSHPRTGCRRPANRSISQLQARLDRSFQL